MPLVTGILVTLVLVAAIVLFICFFRGNNFILKFSKIFRNTEYVFFNYNDCNKSAYRITQNIHERLICAIAGASLTNSFQINLIKQIRYLKIAKCEF